MKETFTHLFLIPRQTSRRHWDLGYATFTFTQINFIFSIVLATPQNLDIFAKFSTAYRVESIFFSQFCVSGSLILSLPLYLRPRTISATVFLKCMFKVGADRLIHSTYIRFQQYKFCRQTSSYGSENRPLSDLNYLVVGTTCRNRISWDCAKMILNSFTLSECLHRRC